MSFLRTRLLLRPTIKTSFHLPPTSTKRGQKRKDRAGLLPVGLVSSFSVTNPFLSPSRALPWSCDKNVERTHPCPRVGFFSFPRTPSNFPSFIISMTGCDDPLSKRQRLVFPSFSSLPSFLCAQLQSCSLSFLSCGMSHPFSVPSVLVT